MSDKVECTNWHHTIRYNRTLFAGIIGGIAGVSIDIDHPIVYFLTNWDPKIYSRFLHIPVAIIAGCFIFYCVPYFGRLFFALVLRKRGNN